MKTHVLMFNIAVKTEDDRVITKEEIEALEALINHSLGNIGVAKFANNVTADYTHAGIINQHLHQTED